jgi:hypothetical protein
VHVALLMCLFGTGYSGFGGWKGTALCPEGGEFVVANALYPASTISTLPSGSKAVLQVSGFGVLACVGCSWLLAGNYSSTGATRGSSDSNPIIAC